MTTAIIYNRFVSNTLGVNRYKRNIFEIWDANLRHGDVRPFECPVKICDNLPNYKSIYPLRDCECLGFEVETDLVKGFCRDQYFYVHDGELRVANSSQLCSGHYCLAGAPQPTTVPQVSGACGGCDGVGVSYVITYITEHNGIYVESAPSDISDIVQSQGHIPNVSVSWGNAPKGYCIVATRLYRVEASFEDSPSGVVAEGAEWVLVAEFQGSNAGSFTDTVPTSETGMPLMTYDPPHFAAPFELISVARTLDGIAVADEHRVYISIAGQPMFTTDGVVDIEDKIEKIVGIDNTILVLTDNKPVVLRYSAGQVTMKIEKTVIHRNLPLKSKRSVSMYGNTVYFSSTYNLYAYNPSTYGSDARIPIREMLSPEQWRNIEAEGVVGTAYEFGYIFSSTGIDYSIMCEFGQDGTDTLNNFSIMPISYINPQTMNTDEDGHIVYHNSGDTYRWDYRRYSCKDYNVNDNVVLPLCERCDCCPWKVKLYYDNEGSNRFSNMRVEWDERSDTHIELKFYLSYFGNEELLYESNIISSRGFSIPKTRSANTFVAELRSCGIMHEVRLATSFSELVNSSNNQLAGE